MRVAVLSDLGFRKGFRRGRGRGFGPVWPYPYPVETVVEEPVIPPGCMMIGRMPPPWAPAWGARSMIEAQVANYRAKGWSVVEHPSGAIWACPPAWSAAVPAPSLVAAPVVPPPVPLPTAEAAIKAEVEGIF